LVDTFGQTGAKIITDAAGKFVASGGKADVTDLLLSGSIDAGTNTLLANVEGFNDLSAGQKTFVSKCVLIDPKVSYKVRKSLDVFTTAIFSLKPVGFKICL
jgi:hypothetical protein